MKLAVNVDHIATIREARGIDEPEPILAALLAEQAGADGIVCHIRGDRRHIKERDLKLFRQLIKTKLNVEMAATEEMKKIALEIKPDYVNAYINLGYAYSMQDMNEEAKAACCEALDLNPDFPG